MSLQSMTGFARSQRTSGAWRLAWEIKSVNAKGLDLRLRTPPGFDALEQEARNLAGAFLYTGEEQDKALGDLSGGERGRLVLASRIASAKNLLILDEPTNHLDIPSAERLEEALDKFGDIDKSKIGGKGGHGGVLLLISPLLKKLMHGVK